jgi:hypothetical protein
MKIEIDSGRIIFGPDETTTPGVRMNLFEQDVQVMRSVIFSYAQTAAQQLDAIFDGKGFRESKELHGPRAIGRLPLRTWRHSVGFFLREPTQRCMEP